MHVHCIGIGGVGISALAQLYLHQGHTVSGTNDEVSPQTLDVLRAQGVSIGLEANVNNLPDDVDQFVYSDAWLSRAPAFMEAVRALGRPTLSYFEALGEATKEGTSIVVSGTHGKTTTTAMLAKVLMDTGKEPTVICGSIMSEYGSNFVAGRPDLFVIEGCEYRRHFLHLHPSILVINNIELDHTDYYRDLADMQDAFSSVTDALPENGVLITNTDSSTIKPILTGRATTTVPYQEVDVPQLRTPGAFNKENAAAAKAAALAFDPDLSEEAIDISLASFNGTWRRFEYKGLTVHGAVVYDDYAHHPSAMRNTVEMVREFTDKQLVVVFHPHLYSRTTSFFDEFAEALALPDEALLLPIYAAREAPDPSVDSVALAVAVVKQGGRAEALPDFDAVYERLKDRGDDTLILTMGAGDVYHVADRLVAGG